MTCLTLTSLHLHISSVTKLARHPFLSSYLMGRHFNIVSNYLNLFFYSYSRILPKFSLSWSICFPQNLPEAFLLLLLSIPLPAVDWLPPQLHPMCICLKLPSYNTTVLIILWSLCTPNACLPDHLIQTSQRSTSPSSLREMNLLSILVNPFPISPHLLLPS